MKTLKCDLCEVTAQGETFENGCKHLYHIIWTLMRTS